MDQLKNEEPQERSFIGIIMHSFFVIPFLIAVFCVLLFTGIHLLTREQHSVYDYLEDVKTGGMTKRWQAAYELSKILANPKFIPKDKRFSTEMMSAFEHSFHDNDHRVRQYLALAMGRTKDSFYFETLIAKIEEENESDLYSIIYALGMLQDLRAVPIIIQFIDHPSARIRSVSVVALGSIGDKSVKEMLKKSLSDNEPNVQWGSAVSLAQMGDLSGKNILLKLLNRTYLSDFPEVDAQEQNHLIIAAIEASAALSDEEIIEMIREISQNDPNMKVRGIALNALTRYE